MAAWGFRSCLQESSSRKASRSSSVIVAGDWQTVPDDVLQVQLLLVESSTSNRDKYQLYSGSTPHSYGQNSNSCGNWTTLLSLASAAGDARAFARFDFGIQPYTWGTSVFLANIAQVSSSWCEEIEFSRRLRTAGLNGCISSHISSSRTASDQ